MPSGIDSGHTAWMLVSTALVLLMTPGLALFYGGMVRSRNVLSTCMHSFAAMGVITVQWALLGYSLAFGTDIGGFVGGLDFALLNGVGLEAKGTIPHILFMAYQGMFAIITPALISGAFAERMKFSAYLIFILVWSTVVYDPLAHWVWGEGGWLFKMGALDFAGGSVVHLSSGVSALVCALYMGKRVGYPKERHMPHNLTLTLIGAGLLWFGWFGFNAGSALGSGALAALALVNTHLAAGAGALAWALIEWKRLGKPSALGIASGLVAGLVVITPAAGYVAPIWAIGLGTAAGAVCFYGVMLKQKLGYDDTLDAFGVHGVGGAFGALATGLVATKLFNEAGNNGLFYGNPAQLGVQAISVLVPGLYAALCTLVILFVLDKTIGLRVPTDIEREGLDTNLHGEQGYAMT
jgi:ammonium transporter, Amt family